MCAHVLTLHTFHSLHPETAIEHEEVVRRGISHLNADGESASPSEKPDIAEICVLHKEETVQSARAVTLLYKRSGGRKREREKTRGGGKEG